MTTTSSPMRTGPRSPFRTTPARMREPAPTETSPVTTADPATVAAGWRVTMPRPYDRDGDASRRWTLHRLIAPHGGSVTAGLRADVSAVGPARSALPRRWTTHRRRAREPP